MDLRLTFNEDAANYDKMRPTYVKELFDDVIAFSSLDGGKNALEIGIGTGQATLPFLNTGCKVTAVELGKDMAAFSKAKFAAFGNFEVINSDFESVELESDYYDLIYSATAFHWIPQETGYPKIKKLLKNGGAMAMFWNHPSRPEDDFHFAMQKVYDKYRPGGEGRTTVHRYSEGNCLKIVDTIKGYGFADVSYKLYHQTRMFDADSYIALLDTYSDNRALPIEQRTFFYSEMKDVINTHGGQVDIHDTMDLYLARKP